jgi:hypothetical protein
MREQITHTPEPQCNRSGSIVGHRVHAIILMISLVISALSMCVAVADQPATTGESCVIQRDGMLAFQFQERPSDANSFRRPQDDTDLRRWLENMIWHHHYSRDEIHAATGLRISEIDAAVRRWNILPATKPINAGGGPLTVLPYPGGRHPRIGFRNGAIDPQRETKVSVFTPWDATSYVVVDIPEAIWSNLGLTYLAHTHIPTLWDQQGKTLPCQEWEQHKDGTLVSRRTLPNGIEFGTRVVPGVDAVRMEMWLTNHTDQTLTDLRVQNCVMLKGAKGFESQTNDNKLFRPPYAACRNEVGDRWVIVAWDPIERAWGNQECPCLHADPQFADCKPGQTQRLTGWLSFYQGSQIDAELARIERTQWRSSEVHHQLSGTVVDAASNAPIASRIHLQSDQGDWHFVESGDNSEHGSAVRYQRTRPDLPSSPEAHTTVGSAGFKTMLPPGDYTIRIERGKEFIPLVEKISISDQSVQREFRLQRWINMADRGWYSGDTHVHRPVHELPSVMLAEDLNVAFPLSHWVTISDTPPMATSQTNPADAALISIDPTHVIHPLNTEYEIFQIGDQSQTLGAVFVLNHQTPLSMGVPPVGPVAEEARRQGGLLDLDKHSWPWSLMIAPVMKVDLFELANNHLWQTRFGFNRWTLDSAAEYMNLQRDGNGFTERGWIDYGFQTYYGLVNCGLRMRVSAGTASGVHPVQLGFGRVYVHVDGEFSYDKWIAGLNAGHSFVSTGPMLDLRFNDQHAGTSFNIDSGASPALQITGQCLSRRPLKTIEVIVNGEVHAVIEPTNEPNGDGGYVNTIDRRVRRESSFWCAIRCFEDHPSGRVRFAHTNPVYVDVPAQPIKPRTAEVEFFVATLERQIEQVQGIVSPQALAEYHQALEFYRSLRKRSR